MKHEKDGWYTGRVQPTHTLGELKNGFFCTEADSIDAPEGMAAGSHRKRETLSDDGQGRVEVITQSITVRGF